MSDDDESINSVHISIQSDNDEVVSLPIKNKDGSLHSNLFVGRRKGSFSQCTRIIIISILITASFVFINMILLGCMMLGCRFGFIDMSIPLIFNFVLPIFEYMFLGLGLLMMLLWKIKNTPGFTTDMMGYLKELV